MFAHLRVEIEAWRLWDARSFAPTADLSDSPKKHGVGFYEKLALRKKNLLQGDLPPERTVKETGTIWKRITPGGKG